MHDPAVLFVLLCWAVFLGYCLIAAFSVKRTAESHWSSNYVWRLPMLAAAIGIIVVKLHTVLERTLLLDLFGDWVSLAGLLLMIWSRRTIGRNWSGGIDFKVDHELIERGPYAHVRHPMYSGLFLMLLGSLLVYPWVGGIIMLAAVFLSFWIKSRQEEKLLTKHFPEEYPRYKARVKALIPYIL